MESGRAEQVGALRGREAGRDGRDSTRLPPRGWRPRSPRPGACGGAEAGSSSSRGTAGLEPPGAGGAAPGERPGGRSVRGPRAAWRGASPAAPACACVRVRVPLESGRGLSLSPGAGARSRRPSPRAGAVRAAGPRLAGAPSAALCPGRFPAVD